MRTGVVRAPGRILGERVARVWRHDARCGMERCDFEMAFEGNGRIMGNLPTGSVF